MDPAQSPKISHPRVWTLVLPRTLLLFRRLGRALAFFHLRAYQNKIGSSDEMLFALLHRELGDSAFGDWKRDLLRRFSGREGDGIGRCLPGGLFNFDFSVDILGRGYGMSVAVQELKFNGHILTQPILWMNRGQVDLSRNLDRLGILLLALRRCWTETDRQEHKDNQLCGHVRLPLERRSSLGS